MTLFDETFANLMTVRDNFILLQKNHDAELAAQAAEIHRLQTELAQLKIDTKPAVPSTPGVRKTLWGSSIETRGLIWPAALARVEETMGPIQIVRHFHPAGQGPKTPPQLNQAGTRSMVYSFKFAPAMVLAGKADTLFVTMMDEVSKNLSQNPGKRYYWCLEHEGDVQMRRGTYSITDYVDAWERLLILAQNAHENFLSCNIFTKYAIETSAKFDAASAIHPAIDVLAWDPYKWEPGTTIPSMIDPIVSFCKKLGKPWAIAETGVSSRNPTAGKPFHTPAQKIEALTALAKYIKKQTPAPEFVCYFNSDPDAMGGWDWPLDYADVSKTFGPAWVAGITT